MRMTLKDLPLVSPNRLPTNIDNTVGAVGFLPEYAAFLYPVALIKCDEDTGEPLRNKEGWCIKCKPGEAGVFL
uniref:Uncharacterized protein n=1 Tax=Phlebotomus papatasi TaxID=29031 RepID=A0A1B0DIC4_PHLPP